MVDIGGGCLEKLNERGWEASVLIFSVSVCIYIFQVAWIPATFLSTKLQKLLCLKKKKSATLRCHFFASCYWREKWRGRPAPMARSSLIQPVKILVTWDHHCCPVVRTNIIYVYFLSSIFSGWKCGNCCRLCWTCCTVVCCWAQLLAWTSGSRTSAQYFHFLLFTGTTYFMTIFLCLYSLSLLFSS